MIVVKLKGLMETAYAASGPERKTLDEATRQSEGKSGDPVGEAEVRSDAAAGIAMSLAAGGGRDIAEMRGHLENTSIFRSRTLVHFIETSAERYPRFTQYLLAIEALRSYCLGELDEDTGDS